MIVYKEFYPTDDRLKKYIKSYASSIGFIEDSDEKFITRSFPTYLTQLYFEFHGNLSQIKFENSSTAINKRTYVNFEITNWFDIYQLSATQKYRPIKNFKVDIYPHTLYEVFGISTHELKFQDIQVEDIWKSKSTSDNLYEELESSSSGEEMVHVFEKYFFEKLTNIKPKSDFLSFYLEPQTNLCQFAEKVGYSQRWIQKEHKELFGLTFKELQNNLRFLKTLEYINQFSSQKIPINLSLLALECNYYDQAHFIKEFKKYSGLTPSEYIQRYLNEHTTFFW